MARVNSKGVTFRTRKGHQILGLTEIEEELRYALENFEDVVLDGEITIFDDSNPEVVFAETSKVIRKDGEKKGLKFHCFDIITYEDFSKGVSGLPYGMRRKALEQLRFTIEEDKSKFVTVVPELYSGNDLSQITKWSDIATERGWEGVMLNTSNGLYQNKRTKDLLKIKKFHSADIICTGLFEGEGRLSGTLGGIYVDFKGTKVGVGTGFTDEQRYYYWNNQDEIVGRVVEIKYFEESTNQKDDNISLRFPVFISTRLDKSIEDVNYD